MKKKLIAFINSDIDFKVAVFLVVAMAITIAWMMYLGPCSIYKAIHR